MKVTPVGKGQLREAAATSRGSEKETSSPRSQARAVLWQCLSPARMSQALCYSLVTSSPSATLLLSTLT